MLTISVPVNLPSNGASKLVVSVCQSLLLNCTRCAPPAQRDERASTRSPRNDPRLVTLRRRLEPFIYNHVRNFRDPKTEALDFRPNLSATLGEPNFPCHGLDCNVTKLERSRTTFHDTHAGSTKSGDTTNSLKLANTQSHNITLNLQFLK